MLLDSIASDIFVNAYNNIVLYLFYLQPPQCFQDATRPCSGSVGMVTASTTVPGVTATATAQTEQMSSPAVSTFYVLSFVCTFIHTGTLMHAYRTEQVTRNRLVPL